MTTESTGALARVLERHQDHLLVEWVREQAKMTGRAGSVSDAELRSECLEFLQAAAKAAATSIDPRAAEWNGPRAVLAGVSRARARQGFTSTETATFVFALKRPVFRTLEVETQGDPRTLADAVWDATELLDALGLYTTDIYLKEREAVIGRQQQDMLELSTPVVSLWDGVLALPMIGTLDSARTQVVMETLLQRIVDTGADVAILDITGVPTVDTLTAQHLLKTVTAARLMGAECIISGIRPQIAQTIVHLGVDLGGVTTKATLADAFRLALSRVGAAVTRNAVRAG